ncbi:MAG: class I SAM-dependent methyltransferase [Proteobacteria bacterium]|nr:class I SAM-dependent methyltransferase [Pseudomonadota bacterium]
MTHSEVKKLYERRPYPHYPLLAKPLWQDGYLGLGQFARTLASLNQFKDASPQILSVGCGEILPYIIRKWEPKSSHISCVDLSKRSLHRAQFRCARSLRSMTFYCYDINLLLESPDWQNKKFDHVEAYGVLHHISNFATTIQGLADRLTPTGTMRVMVYNARARDWIWDLNRAFRLLKLNYQHDNDISVCRKLLFDLAERSPSLKSRLGQMGRRSLLNDTWFADTFMHPWESRASITEWLKVFNHAGLKPVALFDRYAELDDLPNPLWTMPTGVQLQERAADLRFENNLEVWFCKKDLVRVSQSNLKVHQQSGVSWSAKTRLPPTLWSKFPECKTLTFAQKWRLWQGWLKEMNGAEDKSCTKLIKTLPSPTARRLARIGAITKFQAIQAGREQELRSKIHEVMEPPLITQKVKLEASMTAYFGTQFKTLPERNWQQALTRIARVL